MAMRLGSGTLLFEPVEGWEKLPEGWSFIDVAGVAVDARDHVYVFNRGDHPVVVFDRDGNVLRSFGEGLFSQRPHGIHTGPDDSVYCVDDGLHTIQKFALDGTLLMCPLHGWRFDVTTGAGVMPEGVSIGCFPVKVEGDDVLIAVG